MPWGAGMVVVVVSVAVARIAGVFAVTRRSVVVVIRIPVAPTGLAGWCRHLRRRASRIGDGNNEAPNVVREQVVVEAKTRSPVPVTFVGPPPTCVQGPLPTFATSPYAGAPGSTKLRTRS